MGSPEGTQPLLVTWRAGLTPCLPPKAKGWQWGPLQGAMVLSRSEGEKGSTGGREGT